MVDFTRSHFEHFSVLDVAAVQTAELASMRSARGMAMLDHSIANTAWRGSLCLGVGGVLLIEPGRGEAWSFLSRRCKPREAFAIAEQGRRMIRHSPASRIEMTTKVDNTFGAHLARLLGFTNPPVLLRNHHPIFGYDMYRYTMVRDG